MQKKNTILILLALLCFNSIYAQRRNKEYQERSPQQELKYRNVNYVPTIQSVEFYNTELEQSLPMLQLNSSQSLILAFDDLRADNRRFYISIEHYDMNWEKSRLSPLEYSAGYGEDQRSEEHTSELQ